MIDEVGIDSLGAQGDGIATDGTFVPGTLPGERVQISRLGHRGRVERIVEAALQRISPVCPHFGTCGGCVLQHASEAFTSGWKRDLVARALGQRGIDAPEIRDTLTVPAGSRRRVTLTSRRTRGKVIVGFHEAGSDRLVPLEACAVAEPAIVAKVPSLAGLVEIGGSRKGEMRFTLISGPAGVDVAVDGGKPIEGAMYGLLVAHAATNNYARLSWNRETLVTRHPPIQHFGKVVVVPAPGGFLQPTTEGAAALVSAMREAVGDAARIADLFAGSGTFALPLADQSEVHAAEVDASAVEALDQAWRKARGLKKVTSEARDLFHRPLLARELKGFGAAIVDPPRQGARAQTIELARSELPRIGAVSCNPATFARDARTLIDGGFRLDWVLPVDQFRWSPHVELAAAFSRA